MAKSPAMKDENDSFELSDSDDTSCVDKLRHMIRRPDWFEVFQKQCEEQKLAKSQTQSIPEKPLDVSLSDTECLSVSETESPQPKRRQKSKNTKKSTKSKRTPQKSSRRKRPQNTWCHTVGGRRRSNRRCLQTNTSQNVDPEIVFLSEGEPEASACGTGDSVASETPENAASDTTLDDSIEIISETCKASNGKETDFENMEISILFFWQNKVLTLPMKQDTQFGTVFPTLLNKWEVHGANIMLLYEDKIIKASDSPSDLKMLSGSVVECSVVKSKTSLNMRDPNVITIKLQMKNSREKKQMAVNQMAQFRSIIERFAKEEGVPVNKVTFRFDGDIISHTDTPFGLGIENDFSIDVTY